MNIKKDIYPDILIYCSFFITCFFILLQSPLAPFAKSINGVDSSVFIYAAQQIIDGKLIYHDIVDHKGPFLYLINVAALSIFNGNLLGIWIFELASLFFTSILLYRCGRLFFNKTVSALAVITGVLFITPLLIGGNFTEEWALPYISLALYIFLCYFCKDKQFTKTQLFLLSLTFVLTFMLRANLVAIWAGFGCALLLKWIIEKRYNEMFNNLLFLLFFVILSVLPFFIYFILKGTLSEAVYLVFKFNLFEYSGPGVSTGLLKRIAQILINNIIYLNLGFFIIILFFLFSRKDKYGGYFLSYMITTVSCAMGISAEHYFIIYIPLLIIPIACVFNLFFQNINSKKYIYLLLIFLVINTRHIYTQLVYIRLNYSDKGFGLYTLSPIQMDKIKDVVLKNTSPSDKILVIGFQSAIYLYTERVCATKFPYPLLRSSLVNQQYVSEVEENLPSLILRNGPANTWAEIDIDDLLNDKYQLLSTDIDNLEIWKLKAEK